MPRGCSDRRKYARTASGHRSFGHRLIEAECVEVQGPECSGIFGDVINALTRECIQLMHLPTYLNTSLPKDPLTNLNIFDRSTFNSFFLPTLGTQRSTFNA